MNIIIYTICKNEAQFAERFMDSCADADGVYVLDTGSTDGTPELLRELGANVQTAIIDPWRFDAARNASLAMLPEDAVRLAPKDARLARNLEIMRQRGAKA